MGSHDIDDYPSINASETTGLMKNDETSKSTLISFIFLDFLIDLNVLTF